MRTFDTRSFDLAEHFLADYADRMDSAKHTVLTTKLAAHIQEAVEEWLCDLDQSLALIEPKFPSQYSV